MKIIYKNTLPLISIMLMLLWSNTVQAQNCTTGCNENTFLNTSDPNTIEYDNIVSSFHSTIAKKDDGSFLIWGENAAANGTDHQLTPVSISPENGYNYEGTILRATAAGWQQHVLLTTAGLYVWGGETSVVL